MSAHLGDRVAAVVDGCLDDASRDRALAHLAWCEGCRREVDAQRRLVAGMRDLAARPAPAVPAELTARLLAVATAPAEVRRPRPGSPFVPRRDRSTRPGRPVRRTGAAAGALVALGLVSAVAVGSAPRPPVPAARVDPASDAFVQDFTHATAVSVRTADPTPAVAGLLPFAPVPAVAPAALLGAPLPAR